MKTLLAVTAVAVCLLSGCSGQVTIKSTPKVFNVPVGRVYDKQVRAAWDGVVNREFNVYWLYLDTSDHTHGTSFEVQTVEVGEELYKQTQLGSFFPKHRDPEKPEEDYK